MKPDNGRSPPSPGRRRVGEPGNLRGGVEDAVDERSLDAPTSTVNDANLAETGLASLAEICRHYLLRLARPEAVEVQHVRHGNGHCLDRDPVASRNLPPLA